MDGLHSSFYFQVFNFLYQSFGDSTGCTNYKCIHRHFHVTYFGQFSSKVYVFISLFAFLQFHSVACRNDKVDYSAGSLLFILLTITRSDRLVEIRWSICISNSQRSLCVSFLRRDSRLCRYHLFCVVFWLVNTSTDNNKTNHDMWGK